MGQFNGLNDKEWNLIELLIPYRSARGRGKQPINPRKVLNSMIWILMTGARWCDIPKGSQWASKSCAHKHLGIWKENGILEKILVVLQEIGVIGKVIDLSRLSIDGFFSAGKGGGENVEYGYKGKGVTTHLMTDGLGNPLRVTSTGAAGNERTEVVPLLKKNKRMA